MDVNWNPGFCLQKGFSGHLPVGWEAKSPGQREELVSWLSPLSCPGPPLRNSSPPEPGTTFTGPEPIMSFYEL